MKAFLGLTATYGLLAFVPAGDAAPKPKEEKADIKQFEGDWTFTSWEQNGGAMPQEFLDDAKWMVKGDKYTFLSGGATEEGTIKLDGDKKTIDLDITAGTDKGKQQVGLYKIDKDGITICLARPGEKDRPTEFSGAGDKGHILITIKRAK